MASLSYLEYASIILAVFFGIVFFIMCFYWVQYNNSIVFNVFIGFFFVASFTIVFIFMMYTWGLKKDFVIDFNETAYRAL